MPRKELDKDFETKFQYNYWANEERKDWCNTDSSLKSLLSPVHSKWRHRLNNYIWGRFEDTSGWLLQRWHLKKTLIPTDPALDNLACISKWSLLNIQESVWKHWVFLEMDIWEGGEDGGIKWFMTYHPSLDRGMDSAGNSCLAFFRVLFLTHLFCHLQTSHCWFSYKQILLMVQNKWCLELD